MVVLLQPAEEYNILKGSIIMSLLETWRNLAYEQDDQKYQMFWATYFNFEKGVYEQILAAKEPVSGTVKELAERFGLELLTMVGVLDGINDSLKTPNPIETMDENSCFHGFRQGITLQEHGSCQGRVVIYTPTVGCSS